MINPLKLFRGKKVGIALSSGGAKGVAHLAVMEYLENMGIKIDMIAGASVGGLMGAIFACGNLRKCKDDLLTFDWKSMLSLMDFTFPRYGLIEGNKITMFISKYIPRNINIEDLPVKLSIIATDFDTGKAVVFTKGNLLDAVRASISLPGVFEPSVIDGLTLIDGGVANPIPLDILKEMDPTFTIGVNLHPSVKRGFSAKNVAREKIKGEDAAIAAAENRNKDKSKYKIVLKDLKKFFSKKEKVKKKELPSIVSVLSQSFDILEFMNTQMTLKFFKPDVLIEPDLLDLGTLDFHKAELAISKGVDACENAKWQLKRKIKWWL